jgi:putative endonuclease
MTRTVRAVQHGRVFPKKKGIPLTNDRLALGKKGEDMAVRHVKGLGYRVIERNYRCPLGEIDLIAQDGDYLAFIEIKTRRGRSTGEAKEAVGNRKQRKLTQLALYYLKNEFKNDSKARFDVVAISLYDKKNKIELIKDAFEASI